MRRIVGIIVVAVVVVAIAWWIAGLTGQVAATIAGYTIQTTTPVATLGLIVLVGVIYAVLRLLAFLIFLPRGLGRWRARRRREGGDVAVSRTLVALASGDRTEARREAKRARSLLGDTPQTLLLAAESGRLAGSEAEATELYRAMAARSDSAFLGLRGLFRQAMERQDWTEAAAIAHRAEEVRPGAAWLREERTLLAVRTGNWNQALLLAGPGAPHAAYATAAAEAEADPGEALRLAARASKEDPGFAPAALAYAARLRAAGKESRAQDVLRRAWNASPQPALAMMALARVDDTLARVKEAGRFVAQTNAHPESHFLLARLCLEAGLTGEARRHAEAARLAGLNQRRVWLLLADLEAEERGDSEAGRAAQHDALRQAATAEPDPGWRCDACGTAQPHWSAACPACHTPGRIQWGSARSAASVPAMTGGLLELG